MRSRIAVFISIIQVVLFLAHWFLYKTWIFFQLTNDPPGLSFIPTALAVLSVSFVVSSLLAWRYSNLLVRAMYTLSAAWLGTLNYVFFAAITCWLVYGGARLAGSHPNPRWLAIVLFSLALLVSAYGIVNAAWTRVKRVTVNLPNLPEVWRGRVAALVSDAHLGPVRNYGFMKRIVGMLAKLQPDIIFIAGDLYDGTAVDTVKVASPWNKLAPPLGIYFSEGNHEEFSDHTKYVNALSQAGVRVLNSEKVTIDELQVVGVHYRDSTNDDRLRGILRQVALNPKQPSILLTHAPDRVKIAEEEGVSLQLSGHTHGGQFLPFTWIASSVYGKFVYGLQRLGELLVYTSYGAGTWGPPLRVGTRPEIVLIRFE